MADNNGFTDVLLADIAQLEQELGRQQTAPPVAPYQPAGMPIPQLPDEVVKEIAQSSKMDLKTDSEKPPHCLWIDGEPVLALGDISTVIGKAKSRKTFASNLLLAAMVGDIEVGDRIRGVLPDDKSVVVYIDTEQSEYYSKMSARRVYGILDKDYKGDDLPNFHAYTLRPYAPAERLLVIEHIIRNTPDLGFVVIDGIRDLITSINDEEQATMITSKLMKWSTEQMIHICCVLHMNKGDNNARGHVGTELMNKSLAVLGVNKLEKNEDYSEIIPIATRDKEPASIVFGIEDGLPYILSEGDADALRMNTDKKKIVKPTDWDSDQHTDILGRMFANEIEMRGGDFVSAIRNAYGIGTNKAKDFISYFKNEKLIKWKPKGNTTIYSMV